MHLLPIGSLVDETPEVRILYVGKHGNDSNTGTVIANAFLTFGAAITAASALTPTQAAPVSIVCLDPGVYVENLILPSFTSIYAPNARLDSGTTLNTIMLDNESYARFKEIRQEAGGPAAVVRLNTAGKAVVECDDIVLGGSAVGVINFSITVNNGVLFARVGTIIVDTGFGIGDASNQGRMHIEVGDIYLGGNNSIGISRGNVGSTIVRVEHILETGSPTGTVALSVGTTGEIEAFVGTIVADTAWTVAAGGELNLIVAKTTGATVETGTANVVAAPEIETHLNDATIHFTEASIDHTAILNIGTNTHAQIDAHIAAGNPHGVELQDAYDADTSVPQITLNATPDPFTIDASVAGDIFAVRDSSNVDRLRISDIDVSVGRGGRRMMRLNQPDATGRVGWELWPDDFTITTATGNGAAFYTDANRTITTNIPGGGGLGNDTAVSGFNFGHTMRFEDTGFLFAAQLLINAAVRVECATNTVGPLYLFLDQYNTYADGGSRTCSQHNAMRAQPSWGPNINGGSITQTSCEHYLASATVDATVGSASVTTMNYFAPKSPTLSAGGTIGTLNVMDIPNISGPTTIRGINSAMSNGTFINHTGTAPAIFGGEVEMNGALNHDGSTVGFYGTIPAVQSAAYTPSNVTPDRSYDANSTTLDELADVVGTIIADLQSVGLFG